MRSLVAKDLFGVLEEAFSPVQKQYAQGIIRVDVKDLGDKFTLSADLPGVSKDQVKVKFEAGNLTISVANEVNSEKKEGERVLRTERFTSLRSRTFYFGDNINDSEIKASSKDGVLYLEIPKHKPTVEVREISVE